MPGAPANELSSVRLAGTEGRMTFVCVCKLFSLFSFFPLFSLWASHRSETLGSFFLLKSSFFKLSFHLFLHFVSCCSSVLWFSFSKAKTRRKTAPPNADCEPTSIATLSLAALSTQYFSKQQVFQLNQYAYLSLRDGTRAFTSPAFHLTLCLCRKGVAFQREHDVLWPRRRKCLVCAGVSIPKWQDAMNQITEHDIFCINTGLVKAHLH